MFHFININFQHDPETKECSPGGDKGNYIMFARATSGDKPNNNKFSECSLRSMSQVMEEKARSKDGCFIGKERNDLLYVSIYSNYLYEHITNNLYKFFFGNIYFELNGIIPFCIKVHSAF